MTSDMVDYLMLPLSAEGSTDQTVVSGYLTGHLGRYGITSPFAQSSVDVVLGGEYRAETLTFNPDEAYRSGDGAGQGGASPPVSGDFDVTEFFFEAGIPLVEGAPFAEELGLDVGYRYSAYDYDLQTDTFGVRSGLGREFRHQAAGQFSTGGPWTECAGTVPAAELQPVRHAR